MNIDKQILAIIKEKFGSTNWNIHGMNVCKNTLKNHISHEKKEQILKYLQSIITPLSGRQYIEKIAMLAHIIFEKFKDGVYYVGIDNSIIIDALARQVIVDIVDAKIVLDFTDKDTFKNIPIYQLPSISAILEHFNCHAKSNVLDPSSRELYNSMRLAGYLGTPKEWLNEFGFVDPRAANQKKETEVKMNYKEALIEELKKRSVIVAEFLKEKDNLSKHAYRYINGIDDKITAVLKYIDKISTKELLGIILVVKDLDNSKCTALRYEIRFGKIIQQYVGNKLSDYEGVDDCIDEVFMSDISQYIKHNVPCENLCDYLEEYFSNTRYKTIYETLMMD